MPALILSLTVVIGIAVAIDLGFQGRVAQRVLHGAPVLLLAGMVMSGVALVVRHTAPEQFLVHAITHVMELVPLGVPLANLLKFLGNYVNKTK